VTLEKVTSAEIVFNTSVYFNPAFEETGREREQEREEVENVKFRKTKRARARGRERS